MVLTANHNAPIVALVAGVLILKMRRLVIRLMKQAMARAYEG